MAQKAIVEKDNLCPGQSIVKVTLTTSLIHKHSKDSVDRELVTISRKVTVDNGRLHCGAGGGI